jgi:6-phosphogluconate dehydrogenase (decarboxylating)
MKKQRIWEVWQSTSLICSWQMRLTEVQAKNKVENEASAGIFMEAKPTERPRRWVLVR